VEKSGLRYYTFEEIRSVEAEIRAQGRVSEIKPELRTPFQRQAFKLANATVLYQRLKNSLRPENSEDFAKQLAEFEAAIVPGVAAAHASEAGKEHDQEALDRLIKPMGDFNVVARVAYPLIVPPLPGEGRDHWVNAGVSLMEAPRSGQIHPAMKYFGTLATAFRAGNAAEFNRAVEGYRQWLSQSMTREVEKGRSEFYFNDTKMFKRALITYIFAFVLACFGMLTFGVAPNLSDALRRSAFWLIALGFVIHTVGLIWRMALEGRPPVTNLYSSAIFIGWGAVLLGLVLEGLQGRHRMSRCRGRRNHHADHCAQPGVGRGHDGDVAGGARHELLAGDTRRRRHARLRLDVRGRSSGDPLHRPGSVHADAQNEARPTRRGGERSDGWCHGAS
jgi:hypothetical protein